MLKARDIMTKEVTTASPDMPVGQAAKLLVERHFNGLPVVDAENRLVGIICQSDLIVQQKKIPLPSFFILLDGMIPISSERKISEEIEKMSALTVAQAMTANPRVIDQETTLEEIATIMVKENVHTLPVVEEGKLVGIVGNEDVLRTIMPAMTGT